MVAVKMIDRDCSWQIAHILGVCMRHRAPAQIFSVILSSHPSLPSNVPRLVSSILQVLGKYCEKLDPSMAFLAYKRAGGECDDDLLRVTSENGLFKNQARYLVEKQDMDLWAKV